jgi:hypothetical protein
MRLTWRDAMVTIVVGAAAVVYGLWQTGTAMTGTSTRAIAGSVFALGWLGCVANGNRVREVFSPDAEHRAPMPYVVLASVVGLLALVSGVWAIIGANEAMLAVLVGSMGVLWLITTARHAITIAPAHGNRGMTGVHPHVA